MPASSEEKKQKLESESVPASTEEEEQKLEGLFREICMESQKCLYTILTFYLPVVAAFLKVWTLLNPVVEGSKCLAHLLKERIE